MAEAIILSTATLNPRHLIPIYVAYLMDVPAARDETAALVLEMADCTPDDVRHAMRGLYGAELADLSSELAYLMEDHAPAGTYFGSHEGDGACIGFWPLDDEPQQDAGWLASLAELEDAPLM